MLLFTLLVSFVFGKHLNRLSFLGCSYNNNNNTNNNNNNDNDDDDNDNNNDNDDNDDDDNNNNNGISTCCYRLRTSKRYISNWGFKIGKNCEFKEPSIEKYQYQISNKYLKLNHRQRSYRTRLYSFSLYGRVNIGVINTFNAIKSGYTRSRGVVSCRSSNVLISECYYNATDDTTICDYRYLGSLRTFKLENKCNVIVCDTPSCIKTNNNIIWTSNTQKHFRIVVKGNIKIGIVNYKINEHQVKRVKGMICDNCDPGIAYFDINQNYIYDNGEPVISNVSVGIVKTNLEGKYINCDYDGYVHFQVGHIIIGHYRRISNNLPFYFPDFALKSNGRTSCFWKPNTYPLNIRDLFIKELETAELNLLHNLGFEHPYNILQKYIILSSRFLYQNNINSHMSRMLYLLRLINY